MATKLTSLMPEIVASVTFFQAFQHRGIQSRFSQPATRSSAWKWIPCLAGAR
ncbi:hypothetical protein [Bradyrhizobium sp. 33ap4]|uniref:hypothetical protein n=1 Tax=Bradyrhizobium sp. 33ap4 TaxID=3061630 RepID=UPI00292DB464|nr:hypothetical protein [Bradyrhizobium sp. 33ap4]